jgi:hypothetical protein
MGYKYYCQYRPFGCNCSRTRKNAIVKHNKCCTFGEKFKEWIELKEEVVFLRNEVATLKRGRGRKPIKVEYVDMREFAKSFETEYTQNLWRKLWTNKGDCVSPLLKLFLAMSPRFWKLKEDKQHIELNGYFGDIRTHRNVETVHINEFVHSVLYQLAVTINTNLWNMGYQTDETQVHFKLDDYMDISESRFHSMKYLVLNALSAELQRRADGTTTVRHKRNEVQIAPSISDNSENMSRT